MEYPIQFFPTGFDRMSIEATMEGWQLSINWTEFEEDGHSHCYAEYLVTKDKAVLIKGDFYPFD
jgi:hypothetical protein